MKSFYTLNQLKFWLIFVSSESFKRSILEVQRNLFSPWNKSLTVLLGANHAKAKDLVLRFGSSCGSMNRAPCSHPTESCGSHLLSKWNKFWHWTIFSEFQGKLSPASCLNRPSSSASNESSGCKDRFLRSPRKDEEESEDLDDDDDDDDDDRSRSKRSGGGGGRRAWTR